jgi:hypothetical protein
MKLTASFNQAKNKEGKALGFFNASVYLPESLVLEAIGVKTKSTDADGNETEVITLPTSYKGKLNTTHKGHYCSIIADYWGKEATREITAKQIKMSDSGYLEFMLDSKEEIAKKQHQRFLDSLAEKAQETNKAKEAEFLITIAKKAEDMGLSSTVVSTIIQETNKNSQLVGNGRSIGKKQAKQTEESIFDENLEKN